MAECLTPGAEAQSAGPYPGTATQYSAVASPAPRPRPDLPFRSVNRCGDADYDPGQQRHHLLPRQLLARACFAPLFDQIGRQRLGFDDFRHNGLLLPASEVAAIRIGLPLHRGPHRDYNALVIERVGQVEAQWAGLRLRAPEVAQDEAVMRLRLLQRALRRRLLMRGRQRLTLNRHDPLGRGVDFTALDAMVEQLWPATAPTVLAANEVPLAASAELALIAHNRWQRGEA